MNKYDERYEFRLARLDETDIIMDWIDKNWKKNHIMSKDKMLFEYEFKENNHLNIVFAIDKNKYTIEGLYGIIKYSYNEVFDVAGSILKVLPVDNIPFLGVELMKRVFEIIDIRFLYGVGTNPKTAIPLYEKILKFKSCKLNHYYFLNDKRNKYVIAKIKNKKKHYYIANNDISFCYLSYIEDIQKNISFENKKIYPYKDAKYIEKRFIKYPYYDYKLLLLIDNVTEKKCLVVYRKVEANGSNVLRIVDFYGEQEVFSKAGDFFDKLLCENDSEYVDFYNYGFSNEYLNLAGFLLKDKDDTNIIPNYFEPFVQSNVDIYGVYNSPGVFFCKADADQDRPNFMRGD